MTNLSTKSPEEMTLLEIEEKIVEMKPKINKKTINFLEEKVTIQAIDDEKDEFLYFSKLQYLYHLSLIEPEQSDEDLFFWKNNYVKIWCIGVGHKKIGEGELIFFATNSSTDEFVTIDAVSKTSSPKFYKLNQLEKINFLIEEKIIPDIGANIIINSVNGFSIVAALIEHWVKEESKSIEKLATSSKELVDFNSATIRAKRYNFEEMLKKINNEQFTIEFDECLYAYNNEKWFVCAAGLGGILEHLLYLILEKNSMIDNNFPDDATAKIYIEYLSRQPIKLKKREKTYLRGLFLIRNSVSHYNQGFTSKDQCTNLMNGIKNIFNNYYVKDFNL
ncbi:hypothetical protein ACVMZ0_13635 [Enterococcus faecium]